MPTILVVEDDPYIADLLHVLLTNKGYSVCGVSNGHAALVQLAQTPVDLVLSDLAMPGMDGVELCQAMQVNPLHAHIPVILMSAHAHFDRLDECAPQAIVTKPFDLDTLLSIVARYLR